MSQSVVRDLAICVAGGVVVYVLFKPSTAAAQTASGASTSTATDPLTKALQQLLQNASKPSGGGISGGSSGGSSGGTSAPASLSQSVQNAWNELTTGVKMGFQTPQTVTSTPETGYIDSVPTSTGADTSWLPDSPWNNSQSSSSPGNGSNDQTDDYSSYDDSFDFGDNEDSYSDF